MLINKFLFEEVISPMVRKAYRQMLTLKKLNAVSAKGRSKHKTYYSTVDKDPKNYVSKAVLACPLIITSITHRYPAPQ